MAVFTSSRCQRAIASGAPLIFQSGTADRGEYRQAAEAVAEAVARLHEIGPFLQQSGKGRVWSGKSLRLWIRRQIARLPRDLAAMVLSQARRVCAALQRELPARAREGTKGSGPTYPVRVTRVRDDSRRN
jgi:hypothetical protein